LTFSTAATGVKDQSAKQLAVARSTGPNPFTTASSIVLSGWVDVVV
jgi:hypothetical protein